jgi:hypothetical protein
MPLESSIQKAGRIALWIGGCTGLIAITLCLVLFCFRIGQHDEWFAYAFLPLLIAVLISFVSFLIGVIISFALGLNFALNIRRAEEQDTEGPKNV